MSPELRQLLDDSGQPPKLYAWTPANLHGGTEQSASATADLDRRIYILGVGNLGRLYASSLSKLQHRPPITLVVHRKELLSQWVTSNGIEITRNGVVDGDKNFDIELWSETPPESGPLKEVAGGAKLRNLLITTKAPTALPQADRVRRYLDASSTVALAQNGMSKFWPPNGPVYVSKRYPNNNAPNFLACITTHGVFSQGLFSSTHAAAANALVGPVLLNQSNARAADYLTEALVAAPWLNVRSVSRADLWVLQLEKLVVNCIINPLTALLRCKNGALFTPTSEIYSDVMDKLLAEASQVLQALNDDENISRDILTPSLHTGKEKADTGSQVRAKQRELTDRFSRQALRAMVYRVGTKMADNRSSMLQDVEAGKQTEIRDFNGWLVDTARFLDPHLDVSSHQMLIELVESGTVLDETGLAKVFLR